MTFGQRNDTTGLRPSAFDGAPLSARRNSERIVLRNDAQANGLARMAVTGLVLAGLSLAAPFTVIPAVQIFLGTGDATGRTDLTVSEAADADATDGPAYIKASQGLVSAVDGDCAYLWSDRQRLGFRSAMACYASKRPERLCDPQEKKAFLALIGEYARAEDTVMSAATITTASSGASAGSGNPRPKFTKAQVYAKLGKLAEKGYITADDMSWNSPLALRNALSTVIAPSNPCAS